MKSVKSKIKPIAATAAGLCMALALSVPTMPTAQAKSTANQDPTEYLELTLAEMGYESEGDYSVDYTYGTDLAVNGLEYVFTVDEQPSYALMTKETDAVGNVYYDITEIFFDAQSPFADADGIKVYPDVFTYLEYENNTYYELKTASALTDEQLAYINKIGFGSGSDYNDHTSVYEEISYADRDPDSYTFDYGIPTYGASEKENACANISGGIILGYYDIFYPNLIPNYSTTYTANGRLRYYLQSDEVTTVIHQLYYDMKTNVNNGTTFADFKTGFSAYTQRQGYNASYVSVKSGSSFSYSSYKAQIRQAKPVALFLTAFNINNGVLPYDGVDHISTDYYNVNHVMVGCGYLEIDYYNASGTLFRSDSYLKISTALNTPTNGYMRINDGEKIYDAIAVSIA